MVTETVQALPWFRLRTRNNVPRCVAASVPASDAHSFLRLLAANPLSSFRDAVAFKKLLKELRERRSQNILSAVPYVRLKLFHHSGCFMPVSHAIGEL